MWPLFDHSLKEANVDRKMPAPPTILQKISNSLQIPIRVAQELKNKIDDINAERKESIIFKYPRAILWYKNLKQVNPQEVDSSELKSNMPSPEITNEIIQNRLLEYEQNQKKIKPRGILCRILFQK